MPKRLKRKNQKILLFLVQILVQTLHRLSPTRGGRLIRYTNKLWRQDTGLDFFFPPSENSRNTKKEKKRAKEKDFGATPFGNAKLAKKAATARQKHFAVCSKKSPPVATPRLLEPTRATSQCFESSPGTTMRSTIGPGPIACRWCVLKGASWSNYLKNPLQWKNWSCPTFLPHLWGRRNTLEFSGTSGLKKKNSFAGWILTDSFKARPPGT
mmetsp:Transcript_17549/g.43772  ORF Transcript_17549/g.43772 Transcript_17549/m.43772 type:complete len:211 (-) Transcript_17549:258-890(-)